MSSPYCFSLFSTRLSLYISQFVTSVYYYPLYECTMYMYSETLFIAYICQPVFLSQFPVCLSHILSSLPPPFLRSHLTRISFVVNLPAPLFLIQLTRIYFLINLPAFLSFSQLTSLSFLVKPAPLLLSQLTRLSF